VRELLLKITNSNRRHDADYEPLLKQKAIKFTAETLNGLQIRSELRHIKKINIDKGKAFYSYEIMIVRW